ncbi:YhhA family cyclophane-containing RiPP [Sphingomonas molluscorum]|uniref:YhhA family cyclophane-containing RiPP n=1 Tax=Sphingomonas molluscorum TaxID=418184 RepID=UPI0031D32453
MPVVEDKNIVRETLLKSSTTNPALQRLQGRVLAGAQASEVITSYDRMHHRHSRS